jgi:hypothetical protein
VRAICDAFDNFPPGLTGKALVLAGKLPPRPFGMFMQQMRGRLVEVDDSYRFISLAQPARFVQIIREFARTSAPA